MDTVWPNGEFPLWRLILTLDDIVLGVGAMGELTPSEYRLRELCVKKEFRHKNLGKYLLLYLETKARSIGAKIMSAEIPVELLPFFKKCGYSYGDDGEIRDGKTLVAKPLVKRKRI